MAEHKKRQCGFWGKGKYKPPKRKTKLEKGKKTNNEEMTSPSEYFGTPEGRLKQASKNKECENV